MSITAVRQGLNRPAVYAVWSLTLIALIPISTIAYAVVAAVASLCANVLAIALLMSRSIPDRLHGGARLILQAAILAVGAVLIVRSGIGLEGLLHFVLRQTR